LKRRLRNEQREARMSAAICGVQSNYENPGCRFAYPGYAC
jgi:hypothetical protein